MATLKAFFTGMVKDQEGNVSVQQIMGIIFAVILVVVKVKLPAMSATA